jgi:Fe-S cluster biogenesis protein NfuA
MEKMTLKEEVIDIIDQLRPFLQQDGGDIPFLRVIFA